jgi:integrase
MARDRLTWDALMRDLSHLETAAGSTLIDWLTDLALHNYSVNTCDQYGRGVAPLLRSHPTKTVDQFTTADIAAEIAKTPPKSRHTVWARYSSFFKWLARHGKLTGPNPMDGIESIREPKRDLPDFYSTSEIEALTALPAPDGLLFAFLFGSGARKADARNLQRKSVNLEAQMVTFVDGKGHKTATIPINKEAAAAVADLDLFERLAPNDYVWHLRRYEVGHPKRRDHPISDGSFNLWYADCVEAAGVRYLSPHKTRHTYGRWLKNQRSDDGAPLFDLEDRALMMRHDSASTTAHYYPTTDAHDLAAKFRARNL